MYGGRMLRTQSFNNQFEKVVIDPSCEELALLIFEAGYKADGNCYRRILDVNGDDAERLAREVVGSKKREGVIHYDGGARPLSWKKYVTMTSSLDICWCNLAWEEPERRHVRVAGHRLKARRTWRGEGFGRKPPKPGWSAVYLVRAQEAKETARNLKRDIIETIGSSSGISIWDVCDISIYSRSSSEIFALKLNRKRKPIAAIVTSGGKNPKVIELFTKKPNTGYRQAFLLPPRFGHPDSKVCQYKKSPEIIDAAVKYLERQERKKGRYRLFYDFI